MNEVSLSGRVMKVWDIAGDRFARVSVPRDPERLPKLDGDRFDYITVRWVGGRDREIPVRKGQDIEVSGYLQSRDYRETLADFVDGDERILEALKAAGIDPDRIAANRATTEVVAERWRIL
ncbi:hypothetical protein [Thermoflexus sp.]|uniref:hypothetical protein n=1 Tax=Thermoflexus sp. TaxID=1969742 RepID=UPI002ADDFA22|nr:hypothetical protein [Thermoflexus sp.]